jgi:hypothetical protein
MFDFKFFFFMAPFPQLMLCRISSKIREDTHNLIRLTPAVNFVRDIEFETDGECRRYYGCKLFGGVGDTGVNNVNNIRLSMPK